jgi:hypothetical protein
MTEWTSEELYHIGMAEELEIQPLHSDGSLHSPVTIWVVRIGNDLYVRSIKGSDGLWYRAVQERHAGRVEAGGVSKDVAFIDETDPQINARIDAAYRAKYGQYEAEIVDTEFTPQARAATLKLVPR